MVYRLCTAPVTSLHRFFFLFLVSTVSRTRGCAEVWGYGYASALCTRARIGCFYFLFLILFRSPFRVLVHAFGGWFEWGAPPLSRCLCPPPLCSRSANLLTKHGRTREGAASFL